VVLELESNQVQVIGRPIPACESDPVSREQQENNMFNYMRGTAEALNESTQANTQPKETQNLN